jgi:hypothetical protein
VSSFVVQARPISRAKHSHPEVKLWLFFGLAITAPGWEALALEVIPRVVAKLT